MRTYLKATLVFGLVHLPVNVCKAVDSHDRRFHLYRISDGEPEPVGQQWVGKVTGEVVDYADTVRGIEVDGTVVTVTKEEFADLEEDVGRYIEVLEYVPASQIDPIMLESAYYLAPADPKSVPKAYMLLREVMASADEVAIVRYTNRGKTHLAVIRAAGPVLTMQNLAWANEVREPDFLPVLNKPVELEAAHVEMARRAIESMHTDTLDLSRYTDTYTERLDDLIAAKASGATFVGLVPFVEGTGYGDDLLAALEASIKAKTA